MKSADYLRSSVYLCAFAVLLRSPVPASAEWDVAAYLGKAHTSSADVRIARMPDTEIHFSDVPFDDRSFEAPVYYGLRAGYTVTSKANFAVEGEFIHIKTFARVNEPVAAMGTLPDLGRLAGILPPSIVVQQYNVSHGLNLLLGNIVVRRGLTNRIDVALRAGLGVAILHPEIRAFGGSLEEYQRHGAAIQLAGSLEYRLIGRLVWLGEYKFTDTQPRFQIAGGTVENNFATHHFVTGLGFRF